MACGFWKPGSLTFILWIFCGCFQFSPLAAQQDLEPSQVPVKFKLDMQTAARLRPQLFAHSVAATGRYDVGQLTLRNLAASIDVPQGIRLSWELRIADNDQFNAYSSPDGTIYVDRNLAQLAGKSAGLWAAILSHEMEHIVRRDWARRYLYEHSLQTGSGGEIVLGEPGASSSTWTDQRTASSDLASFCRQVELEADREALLLMARAGYHPDFVPALHNRLHALGGNEDASSIYAMHPFFELRDREFESARMATGIQFERLWPDRNSSPGGNPPAIVFAEEPKVVKTAAQEWEVEVPITCHNLVGAVEVVLVTHPTGMRGFSSPQKVPVASEERRLLTGCTSARTTVTFSLGEGSEKRTSGLDADLFVLDSGGAVLSRALVPRMRR